MQKTDLQLQRKLSIFNQLPVLPYYYHITYWCKDIFCKQGYVQVCHTSLPWKYPDFYGPATSARRGHRAFGLSICVYVRTSVCPSVRPKTRLRFLAKVESQDLLMVASWYFIWGYISMRPKGIYKSHDLMTYISWSTDFGLWPGYQG